MSIFIPHRFRCVTACAWLLLGPPVLAQSDALTQVASVSPLNCPQTGASLAEHDPLLGRWSAQFWIPDQEDSSPPVRRGQLVLSVHPEYPGSVFGQYEPEAGTPSESAKVSGDLVSGLFNLDESLDGVNMHAVWEGQTDDAACRKGQLVLRGLRWPVNGRNDAGSVLRFRLQRSTGNE